MMSLKVLKDSLPWLVPSVALVVVGTGLLDRGNEGGFTARDEAAQRQVGTVVAELATTGQTDKAGLLTSAVVLPAPTPAEDEPQAASFSPNDAATDLDGAGVDVTLRPANDPASEPLPQDDTRQAALETEYDAAAFFTTARENPEADHSCKDDLRALTSHAYVYFPSGGLTADLSGIELARLIGVVAQNCPGIQIEVQGHSDPSGDPALNLKLSQARAEQVMLRMGAAGIDTTKFVAKGYGDQRPSSVEGPESRAYYDRRVEFAVIEASRVATKTPGFGATVGIAALPDCVVDLKEEVASTKLFYAPRSISVLPNELDVALNLASKAMACPQARLRVIGHHSSDVQSGESISTGMLRAKALMSMLVSRGVAAEEVILAAPSRPGGNSGQSGLSNSRIDFDVIVEGG